MITWSEIRYLFFTVLRWWWVFLLAVPLAVSMAYYVTMNEQRFYITHTTLRVGKAFESSAPDPNEISVGTALARYYGEVAERERILKPVQEKLGLPFAWQEISDNMLFTEVKPSGNLLEIYVEDTNPERAQLIADAVAAQLIAESPTSPDKIAAEQAAISQQLEDTNLKIQDLSSKIEETQGQQRQATSASDLAEINQTLEQLNAALEKEQGNYNGLLALKNNSAVNSISLFESASMPILMPSKRKVILGTAGLAGAMLSLVAIFVLERLDGRWRGRRDLKDRLRMESLGELPIGPPLMVAPQPYAEIRLKAIREIQTNLLLTSADQGIRTLVVTSPHGSEPRALFSLDLADLFARSGHKVLLVDTDFTSAFLTRMLAVPQDPHPWTVMSNEQSNIWTQLCPTPIPNVALLPSRSDTQGAPALIPSLRWRELVDELAHTADIVIFDGPTVLDGPDAALLAPHTDGVVLALDPRIDDRETVEQSKSRLTQRKNVHLIGAVTFISNKEQTRLNQIGQQLPDQKRLELPMASQVETMPDYRQTINPAAGAPTPSSPKSKPPIITPIVEVSEQVPPSHSQEQNEQVLTADSSPLVRARRPRKASRAHQRRSVRPPENH